MGKSRYYTLTCPRALSILILLLLCCGPDNASMAAETLTLNQALELAIVHNPTLQSSREEVEATAAQRNVARASFFPKIDASETYTATTKPSQVFGILLNQGRFTEADFNPSTLNNPSRIENFRSALTLTQAIYNGGREWVGWKMSQAGHLASSEGLKDTRQRMLFQVAQSYYDLALGKANLILANQTLSIAGSNLKHIANRYQEGIVVKSDLLQAKVRLAAHQEEKLRAQQIVTVARLALRHSIGVDYEVDVSEILTDGIMPGVDIQTLLAEALENRPDYRRLSAEFNQATLAVQLAKSTYLPNLNLKANYELNNTGLFSSNGSNNYSIFGFLSINLFKGLSDSANLRKSKAEELKSRHLLDAKRRNIEVEVVDASSKLTSAHERLAVTDRAVEQAEENLRIVRNRYKGGMTPVLDLFTAEFVLNQAKRNRIHALYDFHISQSRLKLVTGQFPKRQG